MKPIFWLQFALYSLKNVPKWVRVPATAMQKDFVFGTLQDPMCTSASIYSIGLCFAKLIDDANMLIRRTSNGTSRMFVISNKTAK